MEASIQAEAVCAFHPGAQATGTCSRCGSFVCDECTEHGQRTTCAACRERTGEGVPFPLSREDWDLKRLFSLSWAGFRAHWLGLSASMLLLGVVSRALTSLNQLLREGAEMGHRRALIAFGVGLFFHWAVYAFLSIGIMRMAHASLVGGRRIGHPFGQGRKIPAVLGLIAICCLAVGIVAGMVQGFGFLGRRMGGMSVPFAQGALVLGAAVWLGIPFYFAQVELALNDRCGPLEAIQNAFVVCSGRRLGMIGMMALVILVGLAGFLALLVGVFASAAFSMVLLVAFYRTLRNGSGLERL